MSFFGDKKDKSNIIQTLLTGQFEFDRNESCRWNDAVLLIDEAGARKDPFKNYTFEIFYHLQIIICNIMQWAEYNQMSAFKVIKK